MTTTWRSRMEAAAWAEELNREIEAAVHIESRIECLSAALTPRRERILALLQKLERAEQTTPNGSMARLIESTMRTWSVDALQNVLTEREFETLCPRKPECGKLTALLEAGTHAPQLEACAKKTVRTSLRLTPPGA